MADPQLQTGFSGGQFTPPPASTPFSDPAWHDWFSKVYDTLFTNGASFPKLTLLGKQISRTISTEQLDQDEVISVNCGWYSNYVTNSGMIAYGMASNVRRSSGTALVVAGQFTAYANSGVSNTTMFGGNIAAIGELGSDVALVGLEINAGTKSSTNKGAKWGIDFVTGNSGAPDGIGSNMYNYKAVAMVIDASPSILGEHSGWNVALEFHPGGMDISISLNWSAVVTYYPGDIVNSGGILYKNIDLSLNNVPPNAAFWVPYSVAGAAYGTTNYAVGIDFSMLDATAVGKMWSAIRLTSLLPIHFDSTGKIGTYYDGPNNRMVLCSVHNGVIPVRLMEVECATGTWRYGGGLVAIGGGAGATLGTIGGGGPTSSGQVSWWGVKDNGGNFFWIPVWR